MKFKKGKYYIGDPGYVFDKNWDLVLTITDDFKIKNPIFGFNNYLVGYTKNGDGEFSDNFGRNYSVDSSLLGILPIELLGIDNILSLEDFSLEDDYFNIIEFEEDFICYEHNGYFEFGHLWIETDDSKFRENNFFEQNENDLND